MALSVYEHDKVGTGMKFKIVIRGESRAELDTPQAREFARQEAIKLGFQARGISRNPVIYPVDASNDVSDDLAMGRTQPTAWHADFHFMAGL